MTSWAIRLRDKFRFSFDWRERLGLRRRLKWGLDALHWVTHPGREIPRFCGGEPLDRKDANPLTRTRRRR
jgi:hypothetical protein